MKIRHSLYFQTSHSIKAAAKIKDFCRIRIERSSLEALPPCCIKASRNRISNKVCILIQAVKKPKLKIFGKKKVLGTFMTALIAPNPCGAQLVEKPFELFVFRQADAVFGGLP
ncbi:MAG TPA: hypothetical protein DDX91_07655, partial [Ruminococcaceae bacterium]|nr:hypothetical protein [Oscillospiraceae bacterium]